MRAAPATQTTEEALLMDRPKRREVQARLRAVGQNVGVPDGLFGPRTRRGIAGWQTANGLPETGHLNSLQLQLLTVQTEGRFASFLQTKPRAQSAASRQGTGTARSRQTATGLEGFGRKVDGFLSGIGNSITDAVNGN
jgi:peptidoglycan hydrolase-like protein with peptidoglycan-binding domain